MQSSTNVKAMSSSKLLNLTTQFLRALSNWKQKSGKDVNSTDIYSKSELGKFKELHRRTSF